VGYVTVSAKVPSRLKEMMDKYGIKPGPIIREALEKEVKRRILDELERQASGLSDELSRVSDEKIVELIRRDREAR
jgi:polyhydroxyalkanoate synthesis regulator phasin